MDLGSSSIPFSRTPTPRSNPKTHGVGTQGCGSHIFGRLSYDSSRRKCIHCIESSVMDGFLPNSYSGSTKRNVKSLSLLRQKRSQIYPLFRVTQLRLLC